MIRSYFLKTFLSFLPWICIASLAANYFYFPIKSKFAVELNLSKVPDIEKQLFSVNQLLDSEKIISSTLKNFTSISTAEFKKNLGYQWNGDVLRISLALNNPTITNKILVEFSNQFLLAVKELALFEQAEQEQLLNKKIADFYEESEKWKQEIAELQNKLKLADRERAILDYQQLAKSLTAKHPRMQNLLREINLGVLPREALSAQAVLKYVPQYLPKIEQINLDLEGKMLDLELLLNRIEEQKNLKLKPLTIKLPPVRSFPIPIEIYEQAWFKALYQSLFFTLLLTILLKIKQKLTPTFKTEADLELGTDISAEILNFPKLRPRSSDEKLFLSHTEKSQLRLDFNSDTKPLLAVSTQVVQKMTSKTKAANDQQILENLAADLIIKSKDLDNKFFLFTSSSQGAGSTTVVSNLAVAFSNLSEKVLVIDANFHNSALALFFGVDPISKGLCEFLVDGGNIQEYINITAFDGLDVLPLGRDREAASKLIFSSKFSKLIKTLGRKYSFILIDGGSILDSAQATLLSTELGATYLVINANQTTKDVAKKALARLAKIKVKIDGVILNQAQNK